MKSKQETSSPNRRSACDKIANEPTNQNITEKDSSKLPDLNPANDGTHEDSSPDQDKGANEDADQVKPKKSAHQLNIREAQTSRVKGMSSEEEDYTFGTQSTNIKKSDLDEIAPDPGKVSPQSDKYNQDEPKSFKRYKAQSSEVKITDLDAFSSGPEPASPQSDMYQQETDKSSHEHDYKQRDNTRKRRVDQHTAKQMKKRLTIRRANSHNHHRFFAAKEKHQCHYFEQGRCTRGAECRFSHATESSPKLIVLPRRPK